jgi:hypothetical protein
MAVFFALLSFIGAALGTIEIRLIYYQNTF